MAIAHMQTVRHVASDRGTVVLRDPINYEPSGERDNNDGGDAEFNDVPDCMHGWSL